MTTKKAAKILREQWPTADQEDIDCYVYAGDTEGGYVRKIDDAGERCDDFEQFMVNGGASLPPRQDPSLKGPVVPITNMHDYFYTTFGQTPRDKSLFQLPVDSPCGADCKRVIDLAKAFLDAAGRETSVRPHVLAAVNEAIETFWRG